MKHKLKYNSYKHWYDNNFRYNYSNILSLLKVYKLKGFYKSKRLLNKNILKNHYYNFLIREKNLYSYNFWFLLINQKPSLNIYNRLLSKKINSIKKLRLTSIKNNYMNSYIYDITTLFYNNINNRTYIDNFDEKYSLYLKEIITHKNANINSNIKKTYINKNIVDNSVKGIYPLFIPKNNYYNIYFFFNINKIYIDNKLYMFFNSINIFKYNFFIMKTSIFYFFKDFVTSLYKVLLYSKSIKLKKHLFFKKVRDGIQEIIKIIYSPEISVENKERRSNLNKIKSIKPNEFNIKILD